MRELSRRKIYFARNVKTIMGKPDIVFRRKMVAVFIDSIFWHGHPKLFIMPKTNTEYWSNKIERNMNRDKIVNEDLRSKGWNVIRIWDHTIMHEFENCIEIILDAIGKNSASLPD